MLLERACASGQPLGDHREFLIRHAAALFGLRNVAQRAAVLRLNFLQSLLVEMNPAFVPVKFAFQFEPAVLRLADLMLQFRESPAPLSDFIFIAQNTCRASFHLFTQFLDRSLTLANL